MLKKRIASFALAFAVVLLLTVVMAYVSSVTAYASPSLTEQTLPLGKASIKGKTVKHYWNPVQYVFPADSIGSYENPIGTWFGQPEPDIQRFSGMAEMYNRNPDWFNESYVWEPLIGGWVSRSGDLMTIFMPGFGSGSIGMSVSRDLFLEDPTFIQYRWRPEPTEAPGAELARQEDAIWSPSEGAWVHSVWRTNIHGKSVNIYVERIYPNGSTCDGTMLTSILENDKKGPDQSEFIPPNTKDKVFPEAVLYIEYTDGSWGYIPKPTSDEAEVS